MNRKTISGIIGLAVIVIISVIVLDFLSKRPDRLGANPYELNYDEYRVVDPSLIHYRETRNFPVKDYIPTGIDVSGDKIWLVGQGVFQAITVGGIQVFRKQIAENSTCIKVYNDHVYIGFEDHIEKYSGMGELISSWEIPGKNCVFTSVAAGGDLLYVGDAGNRRVLIYDLEGNLKGEFEGKSESEEGHGFIIPSPNFDLVVNGFGELWVVNPGKHSVENYSASGEMRGFWQKSTMDIEGFTGCCNPAEIDVLSDGSFVTSEKGLVRIKVYDSSGVLRSVVAPPDKFQKEGKAPEIAVDDKDVIFALDFDRNVVRVFEKTTLADKL